jgi:uncharacterized Zn-binding protein involved in type VI secretion
MAGVARVKTDKAKGVILGPGASTVFADGKKVSLIGDKIASHGKSPHSAPALVSNGATTVMADGGIPSKKGSVATCGHAVTGGSGTVEVS